MTPVTLRPFHRLTDAEWESLKRLNWTWKQVMEHFSQPKWCGYPEALAGQMGCWSLVYRYVKSEKYCRGCECHVRAQRERMKAVT